MLTKYLTINERETGLVDRTLQREHILLRSHFRVLLTIRLLSCFLVTRADTS